MSGVRPKPKAAGPDDGLLGHTAARFVAWAAIAGAALMLTSNFATYREGRTWLGPNLGADFAAYYLAGTLVADGQGKQLYDVELQRQTYHRMFPQADSASTPYFPYAPVAALPLVPLAALPYQAALLVWLAVSLLCGVAAVRVLLPYAGADAAQRLTWTLLAVSFSPFLMETLLGGQSAAVVMLAVAMAARADLNGRELRSGLWLSVLLYKPTLLVLLMLVMVLQRRWRLLTGFAVGGAAAAVASWALVGREGLVGYANLLQSFAAIRHEYPAALRWFKYVDLVHAVDGQRWGGLWEPVLLAVLAVSLAMVCWRLARRGKGGQLTWAVAIGCTPSLSLHCGVYDSVLIIPAMLLARGATQARGDQADSWDQRWRAVTATLYAVTWVGQPAAWVSGVNPSAICLALSAAVLWHVRGERADVQAGAGGGGPTAL